ncbi:MAG TPA: discoidin domain-containing protein, partial [Paenibacillus sp.]|nr:discoidin domain-containing protein [Paenibacillus sp.]
TMPPHAMKDNDGGTRWSTGAPQANGQWIQVDMGATVTFNQIVMDTAKNSTEEQDYPRNYIVEVSKNGTNWTAVATGQGKRKATPINFPAVSGRYIKITQTGSASNWWSIGELNVYLNNDDYTLMKTLKSRFGDATAENIYTTHQNTWIQESDLDNIANIGLNVIRLPIAWFEIVNEDGTIKSNAWDQIDWLVAEAAERNIYTLLDLHTVPGGGCPWGSCGRVGPNPNEFWTNTAYQDMVVDIWEAIATRYNGNPAIAGYDLINEPLIDYGEDADDVKQKSDYYDRLYDAVRAIDPNHTIYIAAFFDWANIANPHHDDYEWQNVVYEIHPYEMPGGKDYNAQLALVDKQLREVASKLEDPAYGVPVLYGEFSLYHYDDIWAKFLSGLNAMNVSWTNWSYKVRGDMYEGTGGYWGYYNSNPNPVPIMNTETAATITSKLQQFGTNNFQPNTSFIKTVNKAAKEDHYLLPLPLNQNGWVATASSTEPGSSAANAIDWNASTRWSSGVPQSNGQWFQVNLGSKQTFEQLIFETGLSSTWDYARAFDVEVSNDGANWTTVATKKGFGHKIVVSFDPVYAQYLRIRQTGSAPEWWSISELHIYGQPALQRSGVTATASSTAPGESTANAIDASMSTRWSTGAAQSNGQYIQLDFGKNQPFHRVMVDAGSNTNDYMRGYRIEVSQDGANWTTVASGTNSQPAFVATFANQYARYVKIVQTGSSSSWWSVADLQVYGELELDRTGWTAAAFSTESGGAAANALDGNLATRWSSGVAQSDNAQWFEVNMGSKRWFNHLVIDAGGSSGDYVRDYIVQVTSDIDASTGWPTNWKTIANGEGTGASIQVNFPIVNEQFVRVLAKENSGSWWSIHEFRVFE